ncbi:hypothetical protein Pfo_000569, partial [Paulownia fortunei]
MPHLSFICLARPGASLELCLSSEAVSHPSIIRTMCVAPELYLSGKDVPRLGEVVCLAQIIYWVHRLDFVCQARRGHVLSEFDLGKGVSRSSFYVLMVLCFVVDADVLDSRVSAPQDQVVEKLRLYLGYGGELVAKAISQLYGDYGSRYYASIARWWWQSHSGDDSYGATLATSLHVALVTQVVASSHGMTSVVHTSEHPFGVLLGRLESPR